MRRAIIDADEETERLDIDINTQTPDCGTVQFLEETDDGTCHQCQTDLRSTPP